MRTTVPMARCPRYARCSAPLCPLDPDIHHRVWVRGDPLCSLGWEQVEAMAPELSREKIIREVLDLGSVVPPGWRRDRHRERQKSITQMTLVV